MSQTTKLRDPIEWPREGDILRRPDGVVVLVDFHDSMRTSFMCSDGSCGSVDYLDAWSKMMKGSEVIERGSDDTWPWHTEATDYHEHVQAMPSQEQALEYIRLHTKLTPPEGESLA